jgi:plastocyanin
MRRILSVGLLTALMGAGCAAAPTPTPAPVTNPPETVTQPSPTPTPEPTPTPTPKTTTKPAPKPAAKTKTVTVEIKDNVFSPQIVAINAGDTIVWKNVGNSNHTAHSAGSSVLWDSGNLAPGATYSHKFPATGRYEYYCSIHTSMRGTVIVGEVQANP